MNKAVVLTNQLIKDYLLNYARSLIYTTSLNCSSIISADCSFDLLEDGTAGKVRAMIYALLWNDSFNSPQLADNLQHLILYSLDLLQRHLAPFPPAMVSLPDHLEGQQSRKLLPPIIPIMSCFPRPLSAYLRDRGLNARPITWPTVPKGKDRVRVCLHAGNSREDIKRLVEGIVQWADVEMMTRGLARRDETITIAMAFEAEL